MTLSVWNLNVYPFNPPPVSGSQAVVDNPPTGTDTHYALTANTNAGFIAAFPSVGSGGTLGVYTPSSSTYIAGFMDGEQRSRLFFTDGQSIALPTLKSIAQTIASDAGQVGLSGTGNKGGGFKVTLTPASNNLIDATSPMTFYLDGATILILASTQYG